MNTSIDIQLGHKFMPEEIHEKKTSKLNVDLDGLGTLHKTFESPEHEDNHMMNKNISMFHQNVN